MEGAGYGGMGRNGAERVPPTLGSAWGQYPTHTPTIMLLPYFFPPSFLTSVKINRILSIDV